MNLYKKVLWILSFCASLFPVTGKAQNLELTTVGGMWELFSEKCESFVSDPSLFIQSPNLFKIDDWKWMMRSAESVGFIEYFTPSPDNNLQFAAIGNSTSQGVLLHCSLSGILPEFDTAAQSFEAVKLHFSNLNDISISSGKIAFFGDPSHIAELTEYYSTSYLIRVEGGFETLEMVATIRIDDGGSIYFEIETEL